MNAWRFEGLGLPVAAVCLVAAALIALLGVWLRPLYRRTTIAFVSLWIQALRSRERSVPWREVLLVALFIAGLLLLAGGIAGPVMPRASQRVAILVDASGSMSASSAGGQRRFDHARLDASRMSRALTDAGHKVALFRVASDVRVMEPWELATVEPDDTTANFTSALAMARAFTGDAGRVLILSDSTPPVSNMDADVVLYGSSPNNLSIAAMGVSAGAEGQGGVDVLVTVANHGTSAAAVDLVVHTTEYRLAQSRVSLPAESFTTRTFHLEGVPGREVWASLDDATFDDGAPDAIARDDHYVSWAPTDGSVGVVLVTRGNRFLEGALRALGGMRVSVLTPRQARAGLPDTDVVILDRVDVPTGEVAGVFRIGLDGQKSVDAPELLDWNGDHPATRRVSLDQLTIASSKIVELGPDATLLAGVKQGAIAVARETPGKREVILGFDVTASDFPLRLGFPIFVGSVVRWLAAEEVESVSLGLTGHPVPLGDSLQGVRIKRMVLAPGQVIEPGTPIATLTARIQDDGGRAALLGRRAGLYEIETDQGVQRVVLAIDGTEAFVGPAPERSELPGWIFNAPRKANVPLTSLLFLAAAVLLGLRSYVS